MNFYTTKLTEQGSLLGTIQDWDFLWSITFLRYYCVECGAELFSKTAINVLKTLLKSQECHRCGYTLLFGTVKKKT